MSRTAAVPTSFVLNGAAAFANFALFAAVICGGLVAHADAPAGDASRAAAPAVHWTP